MKKKVLILHTGGTFGISPDEVTTQSSHFLLASLLDKVPELRALADIQLSVLCNIDSSDADIHLWKLLASTIYEEWQSHDGFVIIHGTDTMAWTAAALTFFLEKLTKPVVLTGSQRPLSSLRNDARTNIIDAVELATLGIPEVMVCFDSKIYKAKHVTKYSNEHLHAFKSYNSPLIGRFGVNIKIQKRFLSKTPPQICKPPQLNTAIDNRVTPLVCVPGVAPHPSLHQAILSNSQGILLQGFGTGNLPARETHWQELCKAAYAARIPVVMTTQCKSGKVDLQRYENGRIFANLGVIPAGNMAFEAAGVRLMIMLGQGVPFEQRYEFFGCSSFSPPHETLSNKEEIRL